MFGTYHFRHNRSIGIVNGERRDFGRNRKENKMGSILRGDMKLVGSWTPGQVSVLNEIIREVQEKDPCCVWFGDEQIEANKWVGFNLGKKRVFANEIDIFGNRTEAGKDTPVCCGCKMLAAAMERDGLSIRIEHADEGWKNSLYRRKGRILARNGSFVWEPMGVQTIPYTWATAIGAFGRSRDFRLFAYSLAEDAKLFDCLPTKNRETKDWDEWFQTLSRIEIWAMENTYPYMYDDFLSRDDLPRKTRDEFNRLFVA
jgi:hypothetical protein